MRRTLDSCDQFRVTDVCLTWMMIFSSTYNCFTFLVFLAAVGGLLLFGLRRGGFAEYPFLFCAVYLGWLFPQLLALQSDAESSSIYDRVPIVALMVLLAVMIGWRSPRVTKL